MLLHRCLTCVSEEEVIPHHRAANFGFLTAKQAILPTTCRNPLHLARLKPKSHIQPLDGSSRDHHGSRQRSLLSSASEGRFHCALAPRCVFVPRRRHVVSCSKEPAILYSSRTVARRTPASPSRIQELMLGNSRVHRDANRGVV